MSVEYFSKDKRSKDGFQNWCKDCKKQYNQEHKKEKSEHAKQYYQEHKKVLLENNKKYWKMYYSTLKGYCRNIMKNNICEDRKKRNLGKELPDNYPTLENYMELLQQPDFYDGKQYPFTEMGLDRIDNSKPHTLDNIVPCTTEHNLQRGTIPFEKFCALFGKTITADTIII